jgi:hypothetical protein
LRLKPGIAKKRGLGENPIALGRPCHVITEDAVDPAAILR